MIIRYGDTIIYNNVETEDGGVMNLNIAQYIDYNLSVDGLKLANPLFAKILEEAVGHSQDEGFNAEQFFIHHENMDVSRIATDLCVDKYRMLDEQKTAANAEPKNKDELKAEEENRIETYVSRPNICSTTSEWTISSSVCDNSRRRFRKLLPTTIDSCSLWKNIKQPTN